MSNVDAAGFRDSDWGRTSQGDRLKRERDSAKKEFDKADARLKEYELERVLAEANKKVSPAKQSATKPGWNPNPSVKLDKITEGNFKGNESDFSIARKYAAGIPGVNGQYILRLSHDDLSLVKALLEIRLKIEGGGDFTNSARIKAILDQITKEQRKQGY